MEVERENGREISLSASAADTFPNALIQTKIQVPRQRADLIRRPRLVNYIRSHLDRKLLLISAPAGFGKTSLLAEFTQNIDFPVCWLTIDAFDRDLGKFLEYLIASIHHKFPKFGRRSLQMLRQSKNPAGDLYSLTAILIQDLYENIPDYFVLILDDHQTIEDQETINEFLNMFITYVDENCHIIISSRTLPALPDLSLLVARRQAAGLSIDELRFTSAEVSELVKQNYQMDLRLEQAEVLVKRTNGWITGLLLIGVPHIEETHPLMEGTEQTGANLYDYFKRQVFDQQPAALKEFLLALAVFDEINPVLASSVLGLDQVDELFEQVRLRNLFIIEYEDTLDRLRFHDLFHDFLLTHFRRQNYSLYTKMMLKAAQYYATQGEWERAVIRFIELKDYLRAVDIIEQVGAGFFETGRWDTLVAWIDAIPDIICSTRPQIIILRAKIFAERGEYAAALELLGKAEAIYSQAGVGTQIAGVLVITSDILRLQGRASEAIRLAERALDLFNDRSLKDRWIIAQAHKIIGLGMMGQGKLSEGRQSLNIALRLYIELSDTHNTGLVEHDLGLLHDLSGDLVNAIVHYRAALVVWEQVGNLSRWANTLNGLGVVYYLLGRYDEAKKMLTDALIKAQQIKDQRIEAYILASLGDLYRDLGAYEQSRQIYLHALEVSQRGKIISMGIYALDGLGNIFRLEGDLAEAENKLTEALSQAISVESRYIQGVCIISMGILNIQKGNLQQARSYLDQADEKLSSSGLHYLHSRAHLHRAWMYYCLHDWKSAWTDLNEALRLVEMLGFDQFLIVEGRDMLPLFAKALQRGSRQKQLHDIIRRINGYRSATAQNAAIAVPTETSSELRIYSLGQPEVILDRMRVQWEISKSRDLFFYILQNPSGLSRDQIGAVFWPDYNPERLEMAFRSTLYRLRRDLFKNVIVHEDGLYRFNKSINYWLDVEQFDRLVREAEQTAYLELCGALLSEAISLHRGDYLQGVYAEWVTIERERHQVSYLHAMDRLANILKEQGKYRSAIDLYQRILLVDPFQESAHLELIRCYYLLGDRASAIHHYHDYARRLDHELGLAPNREMQDFYLHIIQ